MNINPFIDVTIVALDIYQLILIIWIILSWLIAFNIINRHQAFVATLYTALYRMTEPVLRRVRRYMPELGGIDISPIIVFLGIMLIERVLVTYFYTF